MSSENPAKLQPSPFLQPTSHASTGSLAVLHLRRDQLTPVILSEHDEANEGYDEGKVTNTRFGSFPHSTLIDIPWGSQVRASKVDTGSRGRKAGGSKRKRDDSLAGSDPSTPVSETTPNAKAAVVAQTGFSHLLPPTPEAWTMSLPHRTQVVYTPDYSYVLHRLKARPGTQIIEAGAGSGSFSHAAARAVYKGYPTDDQLEVGKVWSFEFHEQRFQKLQKEIRDHGLSEVIQVTHRDVCQNGFSVQMDGGGQAVQAAAVFLDLPAPWLALRHLTRSLRAKKDENDAESSAGDPEKPTLAASKGPLSSTCAVHICCFLPCIEQVQKAVTALQTLSWQHVSVVEIMAHRIEVRRERTGIHEEGLRGVNAVPANVEEALAKLRDDENRTQMFHQVSQKLARGESGPIMDRNGVKTKNERRQQIQEQSKQRKLYKEGRLVHRSEPELKMHTSYLVFAILPREWSEDDEKQAKERWDLRKRTNGANAKERAPGDEQTDPHIEKSTTES